MQNESLQNTQITDPDGSNPPDNVPLLVTMGDPSGVGPEICVAQLLAQSFNQNGTAPAPKNPRPLAVLGSWNLLRKAAPFVGSEPEELTLRRFDQIPVFTPAEFAARRGRLSDERTYIVDFNNVNVATHKPGAICAENGSACFAYIKTAIEWAMSGWGAGVTTAPIHKVALHLAGVPFPGHTEMFAHFTGSDDICMVLSSPELTTALVTAHVGLFQVPDLIKADRVWKTIELNHRAWSRILGRPPRLTVCGLNCHAGENGLFGRREEEREIQPAIDRARAAGFEITDPLPPDTAFIPQKRNQTDVYICMYHDQGLIPMKAFGFDTGVNLTLGLPIVRTSVDHGTAMDIAFGTAGPDRRPSPNSLACAIDLAWKLKAGGPLSNSQTES